MKRPETGLNKNFPVYFGLLTLIILSWLLQACGAAGGASDLLSSVKSNGALLALDGQDGNRLLIIEYTVGKDATLNATLEGSNGVRYQLRRNELRSPGEYSLRLDGLVDTEENGLPQRRLLPNGAYRYNLILSSSAGETRSESGQFTVSGNQSEGIPEIDKLSAYPPIISPNFDAVDDVTTLNWRTSQLTTVTVAVSGANLPARVIKTLKNQPAQEDKTAFNGLDLQGNPLADGVYTYTVQAANRFGEITRRAATVEVKGGGTPQVQVTSIEIGPTEIIKGNLVTVTAKVKNTGKVPVRSHGPNSGYVYSSRDTYSSISNGDYDEAAGYWRIGVDFEANSGGGGARYPWRWGFGKEYLQPGEEIEITGQIKIERTDEKIVLYVGLIQEGKRLFDRLRTTIVKITY